MDKAGKIYLEELREKLKIYNDYTNYLKTLEVCLESVDLTLTPCDMAASICECIDNKYLLVSEALEDIGNDPSESW